MRQSKFKLASARNSLALAANLAAGEVVGIVVVVDEVFVLLIIIGVGIHVGRFVLIHVLNKAAHHVSPSDKIGEMGL